MLLRGALEGLEAERPHRHLLWCQRAAACAREGAHALLRDGGEDAVEVLVVVVLHLLLGDRDHPRHPAGVDLETGRDEVPGVVDADLVGEGSAAAPVAYGAQRVD